MRARESLQRLHSKAFVITGAVVAKGWIRNTAGLGFFAPQLFVGYKSWITPLLGVVMFRMGPTRSAADFREVLRRPWDVAIGVVGHYLIMPGT